MEDLIAALTIFSEYQHRLYKPIACENGRLIIMKVTAHEMTNEDVEKVTSLDFYWDLEYEAWVSTRFGMG